jgi:hypothetical protein
MEHEILVVAPQQRVIEVKLVQPPADAQLERNVQLATPTAEEVRDCDGVFTQRREESHLVAGLFGLWGSTLLLHDLAAEHLGRSREEEKPLVADPKPPEE